MEFKEFVETVQSVLERDFTHGEPVTVDRRDGEADVEIAGGTGKVTLIETRAQIALDKGDGTIVTPHRTEPVELTIENASRVARFFASGGTDDV